MASGDEQDNPLGPDRSGDDSSEDEIDMVPKTVDNYWLEDGDENPISFATLPYYNAEQSHMPTKVVFLRGTQDNGMRLYVKAAAWKLELTKDIKPAFHVKTDKYWIKLLKPRKSYEDIIRSIVSVAQFLNYVMVNPSDLERIAWNHVNDAFPSWEVRPSRNDLPSHLNLVRHLMATEEGLVGASALQSIDGGLSKKLGSTLGEDGRLGSKKRMYVSDDEDAGDDLEPISDKKRAKFEADRTEIEYEMDDFDEDADTEEVGDLSETVCCICDNGGDVICCDGPCMRSFHLNKGAEGASDANCTSLGFSKAEVERMDKFFCPNCKFKKHQCYICGELGCSDEDAGSAQEVFVCDAAMCGHFYHADCVSEVILRDKDKSEQASLAESIRERKGFVCPMHKCWKCGKGEVKEDEDLQFGVCRRCPRVWHRKCFPSSLLFDDVDDEPQRAWENLLPDRILIFCKRHKIITKLGTPARDHVKFPEGSLPSKKPLGRGRVEAEEQKRKLPKPQMLKKKREIAEGSSMREIKLDASRSLKSKVDFDGKIKVEKRPPGAFLIKGRPESERILVKDDSAPKVGLSKQERTTPTDPKLGKLPSSKDLASQFFQKKSLLSFGKAGIPDSEIRSMVDRIIERTKSAVTIESVQSKHVVPSCYRRSSGKNPDKKHSLTKIESIIKGMRKAVETLDGGGSIEDAKMKCSPALIKYLDACKNELKVYLAPLLFGSRYTSFGRHFTKTEKLEEIVDRLQPYIQGGDMVVDFCCGANEFSLLMKKKLDEVGKNCEYKNFDIIQTKADFNFVKKDWFQVKPNELPDGNRLIMGLNPPFGVKGALANSFIDHALGFKPKLIVLIVPKETERLDQKAEKYDLVWEDLDLLKGQSFYLPGSVDVNENPLNDWNAVAPPLYLWSRPDWTLTHRKIALEKSHVLSNATSGPPRFAGIPWRRPPRAASPVLIADVSMERKKSLTALPEPLFAEINDHHDDDVTKGTADGKWEEYDDVLGNRQSPGRRVERAEKIEKKPERAEKIEKKPRSTEKLEKGEKPLKDDKFEAQRVDLSVEGRRGEKLAAQGNQTSNKVLDERKRNSKLFKALEASESQRPSAKRTESPGKSWRKPEVKHEVGNQARNSTEKLGVDVGTKVDASDRGKPLHKSPESHHRSTEIDMGGRSPPSRYGRYSLSGRKSPEKYDRHGHVEGGKYDRHSYGGRKSPNQYDRHGLGEVRVVAESSRSYHEKKNMESYGPKADDGGALYGERRRISPEGGQSRERVSEKMRTHRPRSRSPEPNKVRHSERREPSPDKNKLSSMVDLDSLQFPSRDASGDAFRDYDSLLKRESYDKVLRQPDNMYGRDDPKRPTWNEYGSRRASENAERGSLYATEKGLVYEENLYTQRHSELQDGVYSSRDGGGRQDMLGLRNSLDGMLANRTYDGASLRGPNEIGASYLGVEYRGGGGGGHMSGRVSEDGLSFERPGDRIRDMYARDGSALRLQSLKYGGDAQSNPAADPYSRYSMPRSLVQTPFDSRLDVGALPERSLHPSQLPGRSWQDGGVPPMYGSLPQAQSSIILNDPLLVPSHGLFDNRMGHPPTGHSQYGAQGRYGGQGRGQFSGGWIED